MRRSFLIILAGLLVGCAAYSYWTSGLVFLLVTGTQQQPEWLQRTRDYMLGWGALAPVIYTLAVVVEVVVAPIPGPLLYAPAGAIFGGFLGGTLSLIGNVLGAALACAIGGLIGDRFVRKSEASQFGRYQDLLRERGLWIVMLLRANPLTSSDLVSYAAGVARVPIWKVAVGTLVGMAPLCYAQAFLAERIFEVIPGRVLTAGVVLLMAALLAVLGWTRSRGSGGPGSSTVEPGTP